MSEWISVEDRFPSIYDFVLVCAIYEGTNEPKPIAIARWDGKGWDFSSVSPYQVPYGAYMDIEYLVYRENIMYWMPLPVPPK